jgi:hypothetical protein
MIPAPGSKGYAVQAAQDAQRPASRLRRIMRHGRPECKRLGVGEFRRTEFLPFLNEMNGMNSVLRKSPTSELVALMNTGAGTGKLKEGGGGMPQPSGDALVAG